MMNRLLLATALSLAMPIGVASAQVLTDPTAFHVTAAGATNQDPVLLHQGNTFTVNDNDLPAGDTIVSPLQIYLIEPTAAAAPTVTKALFGGSSSDTFTVGPAVLWDSTVVGTSFYKNFLNCGGGCDGSVSVGNINLAENSIGIPSATSFNVYDVSVQMNGGSGFTAAGEFEQLLGSFALGTVVAPFATNGSTKVYDTSWTNAGFVDARGTVSTPEASTWVMMISGFGLMAALGYGAKRRRLKLGGRLATI